MTEQGQGGAASTRRGWRRREFLTAAGAASLGLLVGCGQNGSGELDLAESGFGPMASAVAQGAELKLVGASKPGLNFALYTKPDVERIEDLVGRVVGIADPGSFVHQLMVALLEARGIDPTKVDY